MKLGERYRISSVFFGGAKCTVLGYHATQPIVMLDNALRGGDPKQILYVLNDHTIGLCSKLIETAEVQA